MSDSLGAALFQSATRSAVLDLLFMKGLTASVSELARRSGLSPRAVGNEVRHLSKLGLVHVDTIGNSDVVRANVAHAAAAPLRELLGTTTLPITSPEVQKQVRESLAAWGAPLAGVRPRKHHPLGETILLGLEAAQRDGTVLRVLPVVLARHHRKVDWLAVREDARRRKLKAELGFLIELSADLLNDRSLGAEGASLRDRRRKLMRFFPQPMSSYEEELARRRTPDLAKRWGFWMNMTQDSFRSLLDKHGA